MERTLFLNVVIGKGVSILQLHASKYQTLLLRWNTLSVLDEAFQLQNSILGGILDLECDSEA